MLQTLSEVGPVQAQAVLSDLTFSLMPDHGIGDRSRESTADAKIRHEVLDELQLRLKIKKGDDSAKARTEILEVVGTEIVNREISQMDVRKVRSRLGEVLLSDRLSSIELRFAGGTWK